MFIYDKGFTHAGSFHADDVFSTAFLKILNPNIKITRGFVVPTNYDGIITTPQRSKDLRLNNLTPNEFSKRLI